MKRLLVIAILALAVGGQAQNNGGGGRQGFGRNNTASMTGLLNRPDVEKELKLTDDQKSKLQALSPARGNRGNRGTGGGAAGTGGGGNAGGGAAGGGNAGGGGGQNRGTRSGAGGFDPAQAQQRMMEREKQYLDILTADQAKRLKELYVQRAGNRVLLREDFQKDLGLTDDQKAKVADLQAKQREAQQALMEKVRNQEIDRTEVGGIMTKNDKILSDELGKILTTDQAAKLKSMAGAPFKFDEDAG